MRTTLTIEPDVRQLIEQEVRRSRKPFKQVVNEAIRRGLAPVPKAGSPKRFRVQQHKTALRPGIDAGSLNRLVDELEDEALIEKLGDAR
jgi:hypothetical protein